MADSDISVTGKECDSMANPTQVVLELESMASGVSAILPESVGYYKHRCMACLDNHGHQSGVQLRIDWENTTVVGEVVWSGETTARIKQCYADLVRSAEDAACALAILIVRELTEFRSFEQAVRGTTIDYWMTTSTEVPNDTLIFNRSARLEVSGILTETKDNTVDGRVKDKVERLNPKGDGSLPALIVVVEFSEPWSRVVRL